jgi:hypothetical protein
MIGVRVIGAVFYNALLNSVILNQLFSKHRQATFGIPKLVCVAYILQYFWQKVRKNY